MYSLSIPLEKILECPLILEDFSDRLDVPLELLSDVLYTMYVDSLRMSHEIIWVTVRIDHSDPKRKILELIPDNDLDYATRVEYIDDLPDLPMGSGEMVAEDILDEILTSLEEILPEWGEGNIMIDPLPDEENDYLFVSPGKIAGVCFHVDHPENTKKFTIEITGDTWETSLFD